MRQTRRPGQPAFHPIAGAALTSLVLLLIPVCPVGAEDLQSLFPDTIQPLLEQKCLACHGREKQEGGLRLDNRQAAIAGGDKGPAIVPGNVESSLLIKAITFADPDLQMPPKQKLSEAEIKALSLWVQNGAPWPDPVAVLFEDDPRFLAALTSGNGTGRIVADATFQGKVSLGISPLQKDCARIPGWNYPIREVPRAGEYRFLRLAWKKQGAGSVMIELATNGRWPDAKVAAGRYVAGPNTTGWAATSVSESAPAEWTTVTFDLWKDLGDTELTGIAPTCDGGEEAFFDSMILGPSTSSLNAYRAGDGHSDLNDNLAVGNAFTDKRNPIYKLFRGERLDLWSLKKPLVDEQSTRNSIDAHIRSHLARHGMDLSAEADRRTLLRRVSYDLTGLPPTFEDTERFIADTSPQAFEAVVERLLKSPRYGERQARMWLDVVRYADTNGYERDEFRPLAWQYRNYVIRSFNQDKPFDQFIREQLAGDELVEGPPKTSAQADMLIATGFLRLGQWDSTAALFQEENRLRAEQLADLTNTTASAFLGLTMACCQCHDHKYDPFSQADHYRLRAFFAAATPRDDLAISLAAEQIEIDRHNQKLERQAAPLKAEQAKLKPENKKRHDVLKEKIAEIESQRKNPRMAMGVTDATTDIPSTHVLSQGDFSSPREEVLPGFVSVLFPQSTAIEAPRKSTTGRRLTLANWIASAENPWTARVLVNRIWQQHFGTGLVATPNDFGYSGARPTHPELLDWLSIDFVRHGWSVKKLHRMIVLSAAYRQQSRLAIPATDGSNESRPDPDAENLWLGRQNVRRLDAESLRDSLLFVSGLLKLDDIQKPRWPDVPEELRLAQPAILEAEKGGDGGRMQGWYADSIEDTDVRSIFLVRKRCLPIPFLQAFDLPDTAVSCARRETTVVAPQALMLLNSPEALRFAQGLADRVNNKVGTGHHENRDHAEKVIETLFQIALGRSTNHEEAVLAMDVLNRHTEQHQSVMPKAAAAQRALVDLCRAVLNLNEFVYID